MTDLPKLVRDKIPEIIVENDDGEPVTDELDDSEVEPYLREKIVEEAEEFRESGETEELADLMEVIHRTLGLEDLSIEDLKELRERKRERRGGFEQNIILREIE